MSRLARTSRWVLALLAAGCGKAVNYVEDGAPRFAGNHPPAVERAPFDGIIHVVTLNIQFARRMDLAEVLFDGEPELAGADIVLLQEMDGAGTDALARHLGMAYAYYPAVIHPRTDRDFGNAVLSRWPITDDWKVRLPHHGLLDGSQRTTTCASVQTPVEPVDVCSLHLATPLELWPGERLDQVHAVAGGLRSAKRVIVGGDTNGYGLAEVLASAEFDWPTRHIGGTRGYFSLDHIMTRGFNAQAVGKIRDTRGATDHAAVWTRLAWR